MLKVHSDFMQEYQTQWMYELHRLVADKEIAFQEQYKTLTPQFEFHYYQLFYRDFLNQAENDIGAIQFPVSFEKTWDKLYKPCLLGDDFYLCSSCFSHSFNASLLKPPNKYTSWVELVDHSAIGPDITGSTPPEGSKPDLLQAAAKNELLNMISLEKYKGFKSVSCACNTKSALLERPTAYQAQISQMSQSKSKEVYHLIETRYIEQKE